MALPKANRLKSRKDFQAVFREGIRRNTPHFTLRALRPSNSKDLTGPSWDTPVNHSAIPSTKFGISISTKVSKKAVVRNGLKRQITAALHKMLPKLLPGWRLVIIVKPTALESQCVKEQFLQELEQLLVKAEVLDGHS